MGMGLHVRGKGAEEVSNPAQRRRCRPWSGPISDLFLGVRVARVTNNSKTVVFPTGERLFAKFHTVMRRHTSLQSQIEPEGILPTEQGRRPADVLFVPTPLCRQSQWALYPHIALDFAVVSPFKVGEFQVAAEKAQGIASSYAQTKRSHHATQERCRAQGIGFEPVVFEMLGGLEAEAVRLCESLCQAVDRKTQ